MFKTILQFSGYEVLTSLNPEKGLEIANKEKSDLIITDISKAGIDGFEFII